MTSPPLALVKRRSDNELMPPPPRVKRVKRPVRVLDEDTYSDALSHIIARDFFPGLLELESQEEYLDALSSKDDGWIESAGRKLAATMTPKHSRRRGTGFTASRYFRDNISVKLGIYKQGKARTMDNALYEDTTQFVIQRAHQLSVSVYVAKSAHHRTRKSLTFCISH